MLHSTKSRDCTWGIRVLVGDEVEQAASYREVDRLALKHIMKSRQLTFKMISTGFSMDKANVRGLDLSNGIACMPNNAALELLPQAL